MLSTQPIYKWGKVDPEKGSNWPKVLNLEASLPEPTFVLPALGSYCLTTLPYLISKLKQLRWRSNLHSLEFSFLFPKIRVLEEWAVISLLAPRVSTIPHLPNLGGDTFEGCSILTHFPLALTKKRRFSYHRMPLTYHNSHFNSHFQLPIKVETLCVCFFLLTISEA